MRIFAGMNEYKDIEKRIRALETDQHLTDIAIGILMGSLLYHIFG